MDERLDDEEDRRHERAEHGEHGLRDARAARRDAREETDREETGDPPRRRRDAERIGEDRPLHHAAPAVGSAEDRRGPHVVDEEHGARDERDRREADDDPEPRSFEHARRQHIASAGRNIPRDGDSILA